MTDAAPPPGDRLVGFLFRVWSSVYDQPVFQKPIYRRVHRALLGALDADPPADVRAICDVGCGTAQLTVDLAERYPRATVIGVDLSDSMLVAARRRVADTGQTVPPLVRANVYALPLPDASVDLVTSTLSYHWYLEPRRALHEIRRVLRPGGRFLLATMASTILRGEVARMRLATAKDTSADLAATGFRVITIRPVRPVVRVFVSSPA